MLHSGSRGVGNRHRGRTFIRLAREEMKRWFINLPDENLAYFPEGTEHFDDYVEAVGWAQEFRADQPRADDGPPCSRRSSERRACDPS